MAADRRGQMAGVFDRVADTYDNVGVELFKPIAERLVAELAPRRGEGRWTWSVGQRRMWEGVPPEHRGAVREAAYERLDACRGPDGRIGFDQVARFTLGHR